MQDVNLQHDGWVKTYLGFGLMVRPGLELELRQWNLVRRHHTST